MSVRSLGSLDSLRKEEGGCGWGVSQLICQSDRIYPQNPRRRDIFDECVQPSDGGVRVTTGKARNDNDGGGARSEALGSEF